MKKIIVGIIPARYASTRLPGKPLIDIGGKSMIQRVYEQCKKSTLLSRVIVATDDERIYNHVINFGGEVMMTAAEHQSGTDRCAEIITKLNAPCEIVVNIQGDEPFIDPKQINLVAQIFENETVEIATLYKKLKHEQEAQSPNTVKVVMNTQHDALLFSRSVIPYRRSPGADITYLKHIGIYGYRCHTLLAITKLKHSALELAESLEQLRWLENGFNIRLAETELETLSIDTPDDLVSVEKYLKTN